MSSVGLPVSPATTGTVTLRDPDGNVVDTQSDTGLGIDILVQGSVPGAGLWSVEVSGMDHHYVVEKLSGSDNGIYATWLTFGAGKVDGTVQRGGLPFTGNFTVKITNLATGGVTTEPPTGNFSGDAFSIVLPVGSYSVQVIPDSPLLASNIEPVHVTCKAGTILHFEIPNRDPDAVATNVTINEGDDLTLDGSGSSDPDGDSIAGEWDFDGDTLAGLTVNILSAGSLIIQDDLSNEPATLIVTDQPFGATDETTIKVTVLNVDPVITGLDAPMMVFVDQPLVLNGTFTDVGVLDTHTVGVDWGDTTTSGPTAATSPFSARHTYIVAQGVTTITVTVTDDDGGVDTATVEVIIKAAGKMTGGGRVDTGEVEEPKGKGKGKPKAIHTSHGFNLVVNSDGSFSGNLEYNHHGTGDKFHVKDFTSIVFTDDPALDPGNPEAKFDTAHISGTGKLNGVEGIAFTAVITDDGEPGRRDTFTITFPGGESPDISGVLNQGNHQAHGEDEE